MTAPTRFETRDSDVAGEYLTDVYGSSIRPAGGKDDYLLRVDRLATPAFAVDDMRQSHAMSYDVENLPVLAVVWSRTMDIDFRARGTDYRFGPGDVFLSSGAASPAPHWTRMHSGHIQVVSMPFPLLDEVAAEGTAGREPVRFTGLLPGHRAAARQLTATISHLTTSLRDRPEVMAQPLVAGSAGRLLAATVLTAFPSTALTDPTIEDRHDAHPDALRRAIAFIEDHADQDISVADIAAAARVTIRALQYGFRRHRGSTPTNYLREVRIQQAHEDLVAADPATGVTVTEIAARWGFFHPGRFARHYRAVYGRPPHQTLRDT